MSTWEKKRPQRSKRTNALSKNLAFFVAFFIACFAILTPSNDDLASVLDDGFGGSIIEPLSPLSLRSKLETCEEAFSIPHLKRCTKRAQQRAVDASQHHDRKSCSEQSREAARRPFRRSQGKGALCKKSRTCRSCSY